MFAVVSLAIMDRDALLDLVVAIPSIMTIVTEPITHLVIVGLSMACLKAITKTPKSILLLPRSMLVWLIPPYILSIFVPGRMTKLKLSLVSLESSMKLFSP